MILHIVSRSPFSHDALQRCLSTCAPEDALLLIEDGVLALTQPARFLAPAPTAALHALGSDLEARGLTTVPPVQTVDYAGFVELVARFHKTVSWF